MKQIDTLNIQIAKLLHELLPDCIPGYLQFVEQSCNETLKQKLNPPDELAIIQIDPGSWRAIAYETKESIVFYGQKLYENSQMFASMLFSCSSAAFMFYFMRKYCYQESCPKNFQTAMTLLFLLLQNC